MGPEPWLADEMLGRLARYLRFLGYDTEYARGLEDEEIAAWARREGRTVLTRDRALAQRTPGALRIRSPRIAEQLRELAIVEPALRREPRFERCTVCNGPLGSANGPPPPGLLNPPDTPLYRCLRCGHLYWEGSHTRHVRELLARWLPGATA